MKSLEQCKRSLQALKSHITRAIKNCSTVISNETVDKDELETSISFLESKWPGYEHAYMNLEAVVIIEGTDTELKSAQEDYNKVWDNYRANLVKFKSCLRNISEHGDNPSLHEAISAPSKERLKLPTIKLPTFAGDYTEFVSFFDQFQAQIGRRDD